eukprot:NODE_7342_length_446_cov_5.699060_g7176_i0.p1 GENE.NODE_7342_length_446_cov_5.699060_g7176_i0~~NODE_7342_length_446_cov_5.699060_g7176_i0.p1  ORF type:complete len:117 (-),score=43.23 NODE_7342_length_446_cov_5.699060_g7176_i0:96-446(-)
MSVSADWEEFKKIPLPLGTLIHYKLCFERADADQDGLVTLPELGDWAQRMGMLEVNAEDLRKMIQQVDIRNRGRINFWEFFAIQAYLSLNLCGAADLVSFMQFINQTFAEGHEFTG